MIKTGAVDGGEVRSGSDARKRIEIGGGKEDEEAMEAE